MKLSRIFPLIFILFIFNSCNKEPQKGSLKIVFEHYANNEILEYDVLKYMNEAGNNFMVNEIQYFISNPKANLNTETKNLYQEEFAHYIDTDINGSQEWLLDGIDCGTYDSFQFTFGFNEEENKSGIFPNAPESNMFWPMLLGGGYHYMKLNGKWLPDEGEAITPFNFHLGIGQVYENNVIHPDSIVEYVHNHFDVKLDESFEITESDTTVIRLRMNVENWFKNPNTWNINVFGGKIMQNQEAMHSACENGRDVFSLKVD